VSVQRESALVEVRSLRVAFGRRDSSVQAVRGVSWHVDPGETLVIVGESGSGKSTSVMALAGLLPRSAEVAGQAWFRGQDLLAASPKALREFRANQLGMIFQDPQTSLNPTQRVGSHVAELFEVHRGRSRRESAREAVAMLERVRIENPARVARAYPHQLSGGMRQRVMIAMAIALSPKLIIADEPTTALDTSVQLSVLETLRILAAELDTATILITHDLGVAAAMGDHIAVMYAGRIVEQGVLRTVLDKPTHPYTAALLAATPRLGDIGGALSAIGGSPPDLTNLPSGCSFHPRCPLASEVCRVEDPQLRPQANGSYSACHFAERVSFDALGLGGAGREATRTPR
jgi:oligopeptide/dipeptide ABC transporter ATP-binding protein